MGWRDRDYDYGDIDLGRRETPKPVGSGNATLGLLSISAAVLSIFAILGLILIAVLIDLNRNGPVNDADPEATLIGLGVLGALFGAIVGLVLGGVGAFQSNTTGVICSIIGLVLNTLLVLAMIGIILIGIIVQH